MNKKEEGQFVGGFVRDRGEGRGIRVARAKVTELPVLDPTTVQEAALQIKRSTFQGTGQNPVAVRKTKLAVLSIPQPILDAGSPEYARCVRLASAYKKARTKELFLAHGYVSSGVSALLAAASLALSASRFLYEIAASTEVVPTERGGLSMPTILKLASSLSDSSRQNELSAWELCAREAQVRKRNDQNNMAMPWVTSSVGLSGGEKRKPGRPRKALMVSSVVETTDAEPSEPTNSAVPAAGTIEGSSEGNSGED